MKIKIKISLHQLYLQISIAIICATDREFQTLQEKSQNLKKYNICNRDFYESEINNKKVIFTKCGVGKVSSAISVTILKIQFNVQQLIFVGTAGNLTKTLNIGDVVISKDCVQHDFDGRPFTTKCTVFAVGEKHIKSELNEKIFDIVKKLDNDKLISQQTRKQFKLNEKTKIVTGTIVSGDQFISSKEQKDQILADTPEALCCEMEGAAVAQACHECKIDHCIIRIISDNADGEAGVSFDQFCNEIAGNEVSYIALELIKQL